MRWNLSEPAVFSVKSWDAVCFGLLLLYVPETGRYGWLQCPFHFDASAKVRRAVKPCSDFVFNDQSSHVWRKNGHQDESSASSASFMFSSFSNFETPSALHLFIFPHTLNAAVQNAAVQQEKDFRQSSRIGIDHVSSPPKRAKSRNSRGTWRYFMDRSGVVKHVKTDSQSCSGWILHWTEVGLQVPTYEVEPVGTCC